VINGLYEYVIPSLGFAPLFSLELYLELNCNSYCRSVHIRYLHSARISSDKFGIDI